MPEYGYHPVAMILLCSYIIAFVQSMESKRPKICHVWPHRAPEHGLHAKYE